MRLMEPCWANTEQEMLKAPDAHVCLFHYCALNVVSSLPPELIFRSSPPALLKKKKKFIKAPRKKNEKGRAR